MSTDSLVYETFDQATPHTTFGPYTAEDYLQLPEGERVELLRGRLIMMSPSPTPRHQFVGFRIAMLLEVCADSVGGLVLTPPMDVIFNDRTIAQPDVIYLRPDRLHQMRDRVYGAPSLLVEVLSPSTVARDRVEKRDLYGAAGVPEYWIVDTKTRIIEFHILDGTSYRVTADKSGLYQSPVFSEIQLDLTALWQYVDRKTPKP